MNKNIDRVPPSSVEAEQALLGCILLDARVAMLDIADRINREWFYDLRHAVIYDAISGLAAENKPIEPITVFQRLQDQGKSEAVGGITYISCLPDAAPTAANASYFAEILEEKWILRKLIAACAQITKEAYEEADVEAVLARAERDILAVRRQRNQKTPGVGILVQEALTEVERLFTAQGAISGIPTGFLDLDRYTDGLHPGEMVVIAGYPGAGKSSLAMNIAEYIAVDQNLPVGVFSLEMSAKRIVFRLLASRGRVNLRTIKTGALVQSDFPKLTLAAGQIQRSPFQFYDLSDLSVFQLRARARQMASQYGVKVIVIDYLQLMNAPGQKNQSREQEVSTISRGIKMMACELGVPVLALSQLNDDGKLRESRAIGQDADGVWVLKAKEAQGADVDVTEMELAIRKQRDGQAPAFVDLIFRKPYLRFENAAKITTADIPWKGHKND